MQNNVQLERLHNIERLLKDFQVVSSAADIYEDQQVQHTQLTVPCNHLTLIIDSSRKVDWPTRCKTKKFTRDV